MAFVKGVPWTLYSFLAIGSVYRVIQARKEIRGVPLTAGRRTTEFKVSGPADDIAVYIQDWSAVPSVVTIIDDFTNVSGLRTNQANSMVIELNPCESDQPLYTCGLSLQASSASCRYLGVLVRKQNAVAENRNKCIRSMWGRLVLARAKTHTV